jgi:hypothetical protein
MKTIKVFLASSDEPKMDIITSESIEKPPNRKLTLLIYTNLVSSIMQDKFEDDDKTLL